MPSRRLRRAISVFALTAASLVLPLSNLSAAPRSESRWEARQRPARVLGPSFSFWSVLVSLWEKAGLRADDNG